MTGRVGCHCVIESAFTLPLAQHKKRRSSAEGMERCALTDIAVHERFLRSLKHFHQNPTVPIPNEDIMRDLMPSTAHHVLPIARETDRVPRRPIDEVLESMNGLEEAGERLNEEDAEGSVGRGEDDVAETKG